MKTTTKNVVSIRFIKLDAILLSLIFLCLTLIFTGCTSVSTSKSNLDLKDSSDPASGGFVWGQNPEIDKETGKPKKEELTDEEIIIRQEEVLKRQEIEMQRLEREKQDILRQQLYNRQLKEMQ